MPVDTILLVVSLILFILAAVGVNAGRVSLVAAGLAFFIASLLF